MSHGAFGLSCPCGDGRNYQACCAPLHRGERHAETAEELMRARYAAYAVGDSDYLFRTWHPRTRPDDVATGGGITWTGLDVTDTVDGEVGDVGGEVEFTAHYESAGRPGAMYERSRFERRAGRWCYVDGVPG